VPAGARAAAATAFRSAAVAGGNCPISQSTDDVVA